MSADVIEVSGEIPTTPEMAYEAFVDPAFPTREVSMPLLPLMGLECID
jgi:hypothetical protein